MTNELEWVETPPECPVAGLYLLRDRRFAVRLSCIHDAAEFGEGEYMGAETWPECCGPIVIGGN